MAGLAMNFPFSGGQPSSHSVWGFCALCRLHSVPIPFVAIIDDDEALCSSLVDLIRFDCIIAYFNMPVIGGLNVIRETYADWQRKVTRTSCFRARTPANSPCDASTHTLVWVFCCKPVAGSYHPTSSARSLPRSGRRGSAHLM